MKCQKCGKEEVNFHYSSNINGEINEMHLCAGCAAEAEYMEAFTGPDEMFSEVFNGFIRQGSAFFPLLGMDMPMRAMFGMQPGLTERAPVAGAIHESSAAQPPKAEIKVEIDENMRKRREINILREQMRQAADTEDFEKATELRDKIRGMEQDTQG